MKWESGIDLAGNGLNDGVSIHDHHQGSNSMDHCVPCVQCVHADAALLLQWLAWHQDYVTETLCIHVEETNESQWDHSLISKSSERDKEWEREKERAKFLKNSQHANEIYCTLNHCTNIGFTTINYIIHTIYIDYVQELKNTMIHKQVHMILHMMLSKGGSQLSKLNSTRSINMSISKSINGQLVSLYQEKR